MLYQCIFVHLVGTAAILNLLYFIKFMLLLIWLINCNRSVCVLNVEYILSLVAALAHYVIGLGEL